MSSSNPELGPERQDLTDLTIGAMQQPAGQSGIEIAAQSDEPEIHNRLAEAESEELDILHRIALLNGELDSVRARKHSLTEALRIARDKGLE